MISLHPDDSGNNLLRELNEVMMAGTEGEALNEPY